MPRPLVLILVLVLGGCGTHVAPRYSFPPADAVCPAIGVAAPAAPLGDGFVPAAVVKCDFRAVLPGGPAGGWAWTSVERADRGFEGLVGALRQPPPGDDGDSLVCPAMSQAPVALMLVDSAGRAVVAAIPVDACGFRTPEVERGIAGTPWHVVEKRY